MLYLSVLVVVVVAYLPTQQAKPVEAAAEAR
jgi:hypothetical protein